MSLRIWAVGWTRLLPTASRRLSIRRMHKAGLVFLWMGLLVGWVNLGFVCGVVSIVARVGSTYTRYILVSGSKLRNGFKDDLCI